MAVPDSLDERGDAGRIWVMISNRAAVLGHQRVPLSSMSRGAASARAARAAARSPCEQAFQSGETIWESCGDGVEWERTRMNRTRSAPEQSENLREKNQTVANPDRSCDVTTSPSLSSRFALYGNSLPYSYSRIAQAPLHC